MNEQEFKSLIRAFGADPANWPSEKRVSGLTYAKANPQHAERLLQAESALDEMLLRSAKPNNTDALKARILALSEQIPQDSKDTNHLQWRSIAAMLIAAFTIGIFGGRLSVQPEPAVQDQIVYADAAELTLAAEDLGLDDIVEWVEGQGT